MDAKEISKQLSVLQKDIHKNAVEHGWWDDERTDGEIFALFHSELSETLEEYRDSRGMYYTGENGKPEGIAVELADVIIRVLDWFEKNTCGYTPSIVFDVRENPIDDMDFGTFISECHLTVSGAYGELRIDPEDYDRNKALAHACKGLSYLIDMILYWSVIEDVDIFEIIRIKHEFNKTRPCRHGGKKI